MFHRSILGQALPFGKQSFVSTPGHSIQTKHLDQGDQIGRIFARWDIVFLGHFLKITEGV
jgi:hypothetical protein